MEDPNSRDLRFFIERPKLKGFRDWFTKRVGRETDPYREIREELVEETGLLNNLQPKDLKTRDELVSKAVSSEWFFLLPREQIERGRSFPARVDGQVREIAVNGKVLFQVG